MAEKEQLALSIKRQYFDEILSGEKTTEERDLTPDNESKYIAYYTSDATGMQFKSNVDYQNYIKNHPIDGEMYGIPTPIPYKRLKLITGAYNVKPRPYMIVEVEKIDFAGYYNDDGSLETIKDAKGILWVPMTLLFRLGKIIEVHDK